MFQKYLKSYFDKTLLTYEEINYTGGDILKRISSYVKLFNELLINQPSHEKDIVGIYSNNPFITLSAMMACMSYGVSFALFKGTDSSPDVQTKMFITERSSYSWLLLSEVDLEMSTKSILTINPYTLEIIAKGIGYYSVPEKIQEEMLNTFKVIKRILNAEKTMVKKFINLPKIYLHTSIKSNLFGIVYHNGISKEIYNASKIPITSIYKGIRSVMETEEYKVPSPLLYMEYFSQLYDLNNGILIPMLKGTRVIVKAEVDYYNIVETCKNVRIKTIYTSSQQLEYILHVLEKDAIPLLKWKPLKFILKWFIKYRFNLIFNQTVNRIIITGKIFRRDLFNALRVKNYTLLYTMTEIATYVGKRNATRIPKRIGLTLQKESTVNIVKDNEDANMGEIVVYAPDMLQSYLTREHTIEYLLHSKPTEGKLCTQDIGYVKDNLLYVIDKASHIFNTAHGLTIENEKIIRIAQNFDYVKYAHLINVEGKATLVIEPDFDYIENTRMSPQSVLNRMNTIKAIVNNNVKEHSKIYKVILYEDPNGIPRKNNKIISRYF
jgi:hypothetical protein